MHILIGIHHSEFVDLFKSQLNPPTPEKKAAMLYFSERFELTEFFMLTSLLSITKLIEYEYQVFYLHVLQLI